MSTFRVPTIALACERVPNGSFSNCPCSVFYPGHSSLGQGHPEAYAQRGCFSLPFTYESNSDFSLFFMSVISWITQPHRLSNSLYNKQKSLSPSLLIPSSVCVCSMMHVCECECTLVHATSHQWRLENNLECPHLVWDRDSSPTHSHYTSWRMRFSCLPSHCRVLGATQGFTRLLDFWF